MDIKNKVVFITGGASGIGLAIAKKLAKENANVVIYSRNIKNLDKGDFNLKKTLIIKGDVTKRIQVKKAMEKTVKKFDGLDILINNAGVAKKENFLETTERDWDFIINVNIKGVFICIQEFAKAKNIKRGKERIIINIASGAGIYGIDEIAVYSATKAAVINIAQGLNEEFKNLGIKFVAICPGSTDTKMFKNLFPKEKPYHTPEEVAEVVFKTITGKIKSDERLIVDVFHHAR